MNRIIEISKKEETRHTIEIITGSSGKLTYTQQIVKETCGALTLSP